MRRRAIFGDVHGDIDALKSLYHKLIHEEGIAPEDIFHVGDLVDRGPDSGAVVEFCRTHGIKGVMGNHEQSILDHLDRMKRGAYKVPRNPDKARTIQQIRSEADVDYLRALPKIHVIDDIKTVIVHGGLWPSVPFHKQPDNVIRCQLIHPDHFGETRWFVLDRKGIREEVHRAAGWVRWYEVYDHDYTVVFGHTVFKRPLSTVNAIGGRCVGVDTGACFGGHLTAIILPDFKFISVKSVESVKIDWSTKE